MRYCFYRNLCEPHKPTNFDQIYRCCNDCSNSKCSNRCTDDCNKCGLVADNEWVKSQESKYLTSHEFSKPKGKVSQPPKTSKQNQPSTLSQADQGKDLVAAKREARKRRREARKAKLANSSSSQS